MESLIRITITESGKGRERERERSEDRVCVFLRNRERQVADVSLYEERLRMEDCLCQTDRKMCAKGLFK